MSLRLSRSGLSACVLLNVGLCLTSVALAQGSGTPNLKGALPYTGPNRLVAEGRWFGDSGNETVSGALMGKVNDRTEASVTWLDFSNQTEDPIGGARRESALQVLALGVKSEVGTGTSRGFRVGVAPGVEFALKRPTGTNSSTGASARGNGVIPTLSLPVQWSSRGVEWFVEPKLAVFDTLVPTSTGGVIPGYGTIFGLGLGARWQVAQRWSVVGDYTPILAGDNTLNKTTGAPESEGLWGVGASCQLGCNCALLVFGTNASGPTTATSLLAAPRGSAGFGVALSATF